MLKDSPEYKWFKAYQAWMRASNPSFKEYWQGVMNHFGKEFIN